MTGPHPPALAQRRPAAPDTAPLPPPVLTALASIARDMRDVPRDCLIDRAELLFWLRRMAGRIDGVGRMRVPAALPRPVQPVALPVARPATPCDLAEAVFGKAPRVTSLPAPRTVQTRKGRAVLVEVRRARASGQMELGI